MNVRIAFTLASSCAGLAGRISGGRHELFQKSLSRIVVFVASNLSAARLAQTAHRLSRSASHKFEISIQSEYYLVVWVRRRVYSFVNP